MHFFSVMAWRQRLAHICRLRPIRFVRGLSEPSEKLPGEPSTSGKSRHDLKIFWLKHSPSATSYWTRLDGVHPSIRPSCTLGAMEAEKKRGCLGPTANLPYREWLKIRHQKEHSISPHAQWSRITAPNRSSPPSAGTLWSLQSSQSQPSLHQTERLIISSARAPWTDTVTGQAQTCQKEERSSTDTSSTRSTEQKTISGYKKNALLIELQLLQQPR